MAPAAPADERAVTPARFTFVVLTHNRRDELLRTLAHLEGNDGGAPTIVVDNASSDGTANAVARAFPRVRLISLSRNCGAVGRNHGVRVAVTPYVAFCDDDTWWRAGSANRAADVLDRNPKLAVVNARVLIGEDEREDPTCTRMTSTAFSRAPGVPGFQLFGFLAGACMMRRSAFVQAGGYHSMFFLGGEEDLLAIDLLAARWLMTYVPDVVVHHHPSAVRELQARRQLLARNAILCAWMRRPWRSAVAQTWRSLAVARRERMLAAVLGAALNAMPHALHERRVVSDDVEAKLEAARKLRRYRRRRPRRIDGARVTAGAQRGTRPRGDAGRGAARERRRGAARVAEALLPAAPLTSPSSPPAACAPRHRHDASRPPDSSASIVVGRIRAIGRVRERRLRAVLRFVCALGSRLRLVRTCHGSSSVQSVVPLPARRVPQRKACARPLRTCERVHRRAARVHLRAHCAIYATRGVTRSAGAADASSPPVAGDVDPGQPRSRSVFAAMASRNSRFSTLPALFFGSSSTNT